LLSEKPVSLVQEVLDVLGLGFGLLSHGVVLTDREKNLRRDFLQKVRRSLSEIKNREFRVCQCLVEFFGAL